VTIISAPAGVPPGRRPGSPPRPGTCTISWELALGGQVTGWLLATQARLGLTGEARARARMLASEAA